VPRAPCVRVEGHRRAAGQARRQGHAGKTLKELGFTREQTPKHWCVKEAVFPFVRFPGATITLSPRCARPASHGIDHDLGIAFAKAEAAAKPACRCRATFSSR